MTKLVISLLKFLLIGISSLVVYLPFSSAQEGQNKWELGLRLNTASILNRDVQVVASTSNTFDNLGAFELQKGFERGVGLTLSRALSSKTQIRTGITLTILKYEYGFAQDLNGGTGVNSTIQNGIEQTLSPVVIPIEFSQRLAGSEKFSFSAILGVDLNFTGGSSPRLFWKNAQIATQHPDNMAYFAFLQTASNFQIAPRVGISVATKTRKQNSLILQVSIIQGIQRYLEGEFSFVAIRPVSFDPAAQGFSTNVDDYLQGISPNDQFVIDNKGGRLQLSLLYSFSFKK